VQEAEKLLKIQGQGKWVSTSWMFNMSDLKIIVTSAGLALTILGVYIIYKNSPINSSETDGGKFEDDNDAIEKKLGQSIDS
jgi:hypothetical protein